MKNSDYWAQRFRLMNDALQDKSYSYMKNLEKQYNSAIADIDKQMRAWYQRFAKNNAISYADAQKLLTSGQLKEFKWTVEEYIQKAKESAINGAWVKELENASARVHISRLEALKLQLRQQAEMLTGGRVNLTHDAAQQAYINSYYRTAYEVQRGLGYGWSMQALNTGALEKVLSRPWTVDGRTFTARCWTDKNKLVQTVNNELTRMFATGAPPDKAIEAIVKQFGVSRANAGRLIMTESAHFAVLAQYDSFKDLDVEEYEVNETVDVCTCALCGAMDKKHFPMSEFAAGATAPPFHPWCRGCIAPYFADMENVGQRYSRNPDTGKCEMLPANTTYEQWAEKYIKKPLKNAAGDAVAENLVAALTKKIVFTPAKTIEEAQAYAKQYIEPRFGDKTFKGEADFKGVSIDNANGINRALTEIYENYDVPKISGIKSIDPNSAKGKKIFTDADAVMAYSPVEHGIYINRDVLKSSEALAAYNKRSKEAWDTVMNNIDKLSGAQRETALRYKSAGRSLVGDGSAHDYFVHEIGHHVQWEVFDAKTNNEIGSHMSQYAGKISGYATASKSGYFAESFSAYVKGEYDKLDPDYISFIRGKALDKSGKSGIMKLSSKFINPNEQLYKNADKIKPLEGYGDIVIHGTPDSLIVNGLNGDQWEYTAKEAAEMIRNSKEFHGQPIRLISCQTGAKENGIAQQIADELGVEILAPTEIVNIDINGEMFISDNSVLVDIWNVSSEEERKRITQTGHWKTFKPNKR